MAFHAESRLQFQRKETISHELLNLILQQFLGQTVNGSLLYKVYHLLVSVLSAQTLTRVLMFLETGLALIYNQPAICQELLYKTD